MSYEHEINLGGNWFKDVFESLDSESYHESMTTKSFKLPEDEEFKYGETITLALMFDNYLLGKKDIQLMKHNDDNLGNTINFNLQILDDTLKYNLTILKRVDFECVQLSEELEEESIFEEVKEEVNVSDKIDQLENEQDFSDEKPGSFQATIDEIINSELAGSRTMFEIKEAIGEDIGNTSINNVLVEDIKTKKKISKISRASLIWRTFKTKMSYFDVDKLL